MTSCVHKDGWFGTENKLIFILAVALFKPPSTKSTRKKPHPNPLAKTLALVMVLFQLRQCTLTIDFNPPIEVANCVGWPACAACHFLSFYMRPF